MESEIKTRRLVKNFLSHKKKNKALLWSLATLILCLIMSNIYWNLTPGVGDLLAASPNKVFKAKEYWRLFTSSFIHGDLAHFLSNSLMLALMGYFVNYHYGTLIFPLSGFIAGIFINFIVISNYSMNTTLVGASGVVHYLWGYWLMLYIFIQHHIPLGRRLMKVTAVGIFILAPTEFKANVSYLAHFVGLILGILAGFCHYFLLREKIKSYEVWEEHVEEVDEDLAHEAENSHSPSKFLH